MSFHAPARMRPRFMPALLLLSAVLCCPAAARILPVTAGQSAQLGIKTAPVRLAATKSLVSVLGRVTPAPDARIPVSAPFAGTVKSLVRLEGEAVTKGGVLAVITSADMHAALAKLHGQEAHYRSAKAAADRAKALVAEGIAPASRAEQANAEAAAAAAELASLRSATARARGAEGGEYRLLAPASGRVAAIAVAVGDQLTAMQPVLTIQNGNALWVEGDLPAAMAGRVAAGDGVRIEGSNVTGEVMAAGSSIDPKTRSAMVRARLVNPGTLISGQTVRLSIDRKADAGSFTVPRNAVAQIANGTAVFVARQGGFEIVSVRVLARGEDAATITGALRAGDRVAVTGVSELKAIGLRE
jgi:membrane fusion protein, heavy metal efflux system